MENPPTEPKTLPPWLQTLCDKLEQDPQITRHCGTDGIPTLGPVHSAARRNDAVALAIARARQAGSHHMLRRIEEAAEGPADGDDSSVRVARDRLRIDTLRYLAGVYDPEHLGDHRHRDRPGSINVTVITGVPEPDPPRVTVSPVELPPADDEHA